MEASYQNWCYIKTSRIEPQGADPPSLPLRVVKAGRNYLPEEITSLLPAGIGERYSQTKPNIEIAALSLILQKKCGTKLRRPSSLLITLSI